MYSVGFSRTFVAQHHLVSAPGPEKKTHSHVYRVEIAFRGPRLDEHGYLLDFLELRKHLDSVVETLRDRTLNELTPFNNLNPTIERLAKVIGQELQERISMAGMSSLHVKVWESDAAWAAFQWDFP